jgi:hypothetical protein
MNYSKYRLVLESMLVYQYSQETIKRFIREWVKASGVKNLASGKIEAEMWYDRDAMIYTAFYDSSYWTGVNFKGFDVKDPGVIETL